MAATTPIPLLPDAPSRSQGQAAFNEKADPFIAALPPMVVNINSRLTWISEQVTTIDGYRQAAATSATNAAAQVALAAAQVALANTARLSAENAASSANAAAAAAGQGAGFPQDGSVGDVLLLAYGGQVEWGTPDPAYPSLAGNSRKPLTPNAALNGVQWGDEISIPKYIDKFFYGASAAAFALDLGIYSVFNITLTVNTVLSIANKPNMEVTETLTIVIRIAQPSSPKTLTWFSGIYWLTPGNVVPPTPAANQTVEYILSTPGTGGYNWVGRVGGST